MENNKEQLFTSKLSDVEIKSLQRYEFAQKYCHCKGVLDAACGCGYGSNILSKEAKSVLGIDYSQEAIDYAQEVWAAKNITFKQVEINSDLTTLGKFDVVVSLETVEHLDAPIIETCQKFHKILRPGGLLVLSHPEKEALPGTKIKEHNPNKPLLTETITRYIKRAPYHLYKRNFSVIWGFINSKIPRKRRGPIIYHKHFNIDGESVKNSLIDIGFQIKDEWYQPGRFYYPYHVIVVEKNE